MPKRKPKKTPAPTAEAVIRAIIEPIVADLFTNGVGENGEWLMLTKGGFFLGRECPMRARMVITSTSLSESAMVDRIVAKLTGTLKPPTARNGGSR